MMDYKNKIIDYRDFYNKNYENISKACICIESNPCSKLLDDIDISIGEVNRQIVNFENWTDTNGQDYIKFLEDIINLFTKIRGSIESDFATSEGLYKSILNDLKNLLRVIDDFESKYSLKPKNSSFIVSKSESETSSINNEMIDKKFSYYDYDAYNRALDNWKSLCKACDNKCEIIINDIKVKLDKLNVINDVVFEINQIENIKFNAETFTQLTDYIFNNQNFKILNINGGLEAVLNAIGRQKPDECYQWADKYSNYIYKHSDYSKSNSNVGLSCSNSSDVLKILASELSIGNPVKIQVNGTEKNGKMGRHFVTVVGISESANPNDLKSSDFLCLDPSGARIIRLDTEREDGKKRNLISAQDVTYRVRNDNEYLLEIYNDPESYLSDDCKITLV